MIDNKLWVECLMRDKGALKAFQTFLEERYNASCKEAIDHFKKNDFESMRSASAVAVAWEAVRQQVSIYLREEEQKAIIQGQRKAG